jgi:hypothetical protein
MPRRPATVTAPNATRPPVEHPLFEELLTIGERDLVVIEVGRVRHRPPSRN